MLKKKIEIQLSKNHSSKKIQVNCFKREDITLHLVV